MNTLTVIVEDDFKPTEAEEFSEKIVKVLAARALENFVQLSESVGVETTEIFVELLHEARCRSRSNSFAATKKRRDEYERETDDRTRRIRAADPDPCAQ